MTLGPSFRALPTCSAGISAGRARRREDFAMPEVNYKEAIPTLKDEIEHETVEKVLALDVDKYKYGFETEIEYDVATVGLSEETIRQISGKKNEPEWMLDWRLEAYRRWLTMREPNWAKVLYPRIDFQAISYYAAPK